MCSSHLFFFFNTTAPSEIYTLSLHDALPISQLPGTASGGSWAAAARCGTESPTTPRASCCMWARAMRSRGRKRSRSEEHTSELQSQFHLVCRLLLEKKKKKKKEVRRITQHNK